MEHSCARYHPSHLACVLSFNPDSSHTAKCCCFPGSQVRTLNEVQSLLTQGRTGDAAPTAPQNLGIARQEDAGVSMGAPVAGTYHGEDMGKVCLAWELPPSRILWPLHVCCVLTSSCCPGHSWGWCPHPEVGVSI